MSWHRSLAAASSDETSGERRGLTNMTEISRRDALATIAAGGAGMPAVRLRSTNGRCVDVHETMRARTRIYCYPRTGRLGEEIGPAWDEIPGARRCTPETCTFRDHHVMSENSIDATTPELANRRASAAPGGSRTRIAGLSEQYLHVRGLSPRSRLALRRTTDSRALSSLCSERIQRRAYAAGRW